MSEKGLWGGLYLIGSTFGDHLSTNDSFGGNTEQMTSFCPMKSVPPIGRVAPNI